MQLGMFACAQFRLPVNLMKRACIARQQRAKEAVDATGRHVHWDLPMSFEKCLDCKQGKEIAMEEQESTEQAPSTPATRTCVKCGEAKPETEFYKSTSGGLEGQCKMCKMQRVKENKRKKKAEGGRLKAEGKQPSAPAHLPEKKESPLQRQVGGDHYKGFAVQPVEFITRNRLGFLEGCIIKRLCRYNRPGGKGREDLQKIAHEVELLMEMEV